MDVPPQPAVLSEATLMIQPSIVDRLDFRSVFGTERPVEVELGAGDGSFLIEYAARKPERNFLGVERLLGRLRKIDRKARRRGLDNVRALRLEAAYVVEWMIPMASVYAIHVYFPDPWPKRRHWRRRLINLTFAAVAWKALRPGGILYLRTDHPGYFDQMMEVMGLCRSFSRTNEPPDLLEVTTDFERGFQAKGIPTLHAAFQRPLNPLGSAGEVAGGGGGTGVVVVAGAAGGSVENWVLGGSSNRTNLDVSVVVAVGKLVKPLKAGRAGCWAWAWTGGLGNPTGSLGLNSSSTSNVPSAASSSKISSSCSSCEAGLAGAVGKKSVTMNGGWV